MIGEQLTSVMTTERLSLSILSEQDADFMQRLLNTEGWLRFIGDRNVHSVEDAIAYIRKIKSTADFHYWVARLKSSGTPLGIVTLIKRVYLPHFDIGFAFMPEYGGYGYAFEAAGEVMNMLKGYSLYNPILATTVPHNVQSIKLLTKLGLQFEREIEVEKERLHVYTNEK
jgi:ribosomal-protein-alanine N-acetyltransferase